MNAYTWGLVFGISLGIGIFLIATLVSRKKHPEYNKYDERQIVGRGKAFQAGFFTTLIASAAVTIWEYIDGLPGVPFLWHICALMLGVAVFALTAIHFDAYIGMNDSPMRWVKIGLLFVVAMGLSGYANLRTDRPEGRVMAFLNLTIAVIWIVLVVALMIHRRNAQKEAEE